MAPYEALYRRPCRSLIFLDGGGIKIHHGSGFD